MCEIYQPWSKTAPISPSSLIRFRKTPHSWRFKDMPFVTFPISRMHTWALFLKLRYENLYSGWQIYCYVSQSHESALSRNYFHISTAFINFILFHQVRIEMCNTWWFDKHQKLITNSYHTHSNLTHWFSCMTLLPLFQT